MKSIQMVHWKNFIMSDFSLFGGREGFIIGGSTVICCYGNAHVPVWSVFYSS